MVLLHLVALLIGSWTASPPDVAGAPIGTRVPRAADTAGVAVIMHDGDGPDSLDVAEIRRIFLLRQRFWEDGSPVVPVNLPARSSLREEFSDLALGQSPRDLAQYWSDLYFHGTQPPRVLDSEEAVLLYVARTPGAIGYVSVAFLRQNPLPGQVHLAHLWAPGREGMLDRGRPGPRSSTSARPSTFCRSCEP